MKRSVCFLFALLLVTNLVGCGSNYVATNVFTNLGIEKFADKDSVVLVKSYDDLTTYCDEIQIEKCDNQFKTKVLSYDEHFFDEKMLVLLYHWETTSSSKLIITDIEIKNDNANIIIKRDAPKIVDDEMKDYFFIIELQQDALCNSATCEIK